MVTEGKHPFAGLAPGATSERVEGVGANARRRVGGDAGGLEHVRR